MAQIGILSSGGGTHGALIVCEDIVSPYAKCLCKKINIHAESLFMRILLAMKTFFLATVAWVFFRVTEVNDAILFFHQSVLGNNGSFFKLISKLLEMLGKRELAFFIAGLGIGIIALIIHSLMRERGIPPLAWLSAQKVYVRYSVYWTLVLLIIMSLDVGGKAFIYFQF